MSTFSSIVCRQQANTLLEIRDFILLRRMTSDGFYRKPSDPNCCIKHYPEHGTFCKVLALDDINELPLAIILTRPVAQNHDAKLF